MATTTKAATTKHPAAMMLGALGGRVGSKAQRAARRRNIAKATAVRLAKQRARKAAAR
jgi:hypothetical protein